MYKKLSYVFTGLVVFFILVTFKNWFINQSIIGGDWPYIYKDALSYYTNFPSGWNFGIGNGMGGVNQTFFLNLYFNLAVLIGGYLKIPWETVYKIFWFGLFIFLSCFSSGYLFRMFLKKTNIYPLAISAVIFSTNTYILMVVGGGQMGVALAYSVAPLILAQVLNVLNSKGVFSKSLKNSLLLGLYMGLQILFDPRITYITIIFILLFLFYWYGYRLVQEILISKKIPSKKIVSRIFYLTLFVLLIPGSISFLLHASWLLPLLIFRENPVTELSSVHKTVEALQFFSFANFSNTISLLHPNWPENIFGKISFMKAEFLLLPLIAFLGLSLKKSIFEKDSFLKIDFYSSYLIFCSIGLIGAFLAKGANPFLGDVFIWAFKYIPGFILFRDPTKFYILISLSFSILIPSSLMLIVQYFETNKTLFAVSYQLKCFLIFTLFIVLWSLLNRQIFQNELRGTFQYHSVPNEYIQLKDILINDKNFYRTLWVPQQSRFSFYSPNHPAVEAAPLLQATNSAEILKAFMKKGTQERLAQSSIRYVAVPFDALAEIFVKDRKYDENEYRNTVKALEKISWLKRINSFKDIAVFELPYFYDHFYISVGKTIYYRFIDQSRYKAKINLANPSLLVFSESYNKNWIVGKDNSIIASQKTLGNLNSFSLPAGKYTIDVIYTPSFYYQLGGYISISTILLALIILFFLRRS